MPPGMKTLLIPLVVAATLALPAGALAWGGHEHHAGFASFGFRFRAAEDNGGGGMFAKLSGTGASFGGTTATGTGSIVAGNDHPNGHFSVSLSTTWSSATSKTFTDNDGDSDDGTLTVSCAPATASITLTDGSTTTSSLTGKTCSWALNGTTTYGFFGVDSMGTVHAFLKEDSSNNVTGGVITRTQGTDQDNDDDQGGSGDQGNMPSIHFGFGLFSTGGWAWHNH